VYGFSSPICVPLSLTVYSWIVVNAGGTKPENKGTTKSNASACEILTQEKIIANADIVSQPRLNQAIEKLKANDRIVMHQGGGKRFRKFFNAGKIIAAGYFVDAEIIDKSNKGRYLRLYNLVRRYFPGVELKGLLTFRLKKAQTMLDVEAVGYRPHSRINFIPITSSHSRYGVLNAFWHQCMSQ